MKNLIHRIVRGGALAAALATSAIPADLRAESSESAAALLYSQAAFDEDVTTMGGRPLRYTPTTGFIARWAPFIEEGKPRPGWWDGPYFLGVTDGRTALEERGLALVGSYVNNILGNPVGGRAQGFAYDHSIGLEADFELGKLVGWKGARFVISALNRTGTNLSGEYIGNQFTASQLWGNPTMVFYGLWLEQLLLNDQLSLKAGRIGAGDEFASSPYYWLYVQNAIDGNPQALPVNFPFSTYPNATWGARVKVKTTDEKYYAMGGVYQATSRLGNPAYHGLDFSIRPQDGLSTVWEIGWRPRFGEKQRAGETATPSGKSVVEGRKGVVQAEEPLQDQPRPGHQGNYKLGAYWSNWSFTGFDGTGYSNNYGFYAAMDQVLYRESPITSQGLGLWSVLTWAPQQELAKLPLYASGGLAYRGLIPSRDLDISAVGVFYGQFSRDLRSAQQNAGDPGQVYELALEATYRIVFNKFFYVQPDVQYIINPGGAHQYGNALVLGAQIGVNF